MIKHVLQKISVCSLLAFAFQTNAATFTVTNTNDTGAGSLRQAINDANANAGADKIVFSGISYPAVITLASTLEATGFSDNNLIIEGPGKDLLTIEGNLSFQIFTFTLPTTVSGLSISKGRTVSPTFAGGGIYALSALYLSDVKVSGCTGTSSNGIGIFAGSTLTILNSEVSGNTADQGSKGGGIYVTSVLRMKNTIVSGNQLSRIGFGGGLYTKGNVIIENSDISTNFCTASTNDETQGGGIYISTGTISTISGTSFYLNRLSSRSRSVGGSIYMFDGANLTLINSTIAYSQASGAAFTSTATGGLGGGIGAGFNTDLKITNCTISENQASTSSTSGIYLEGFLTIKNSIIKSNFYSTYLWTQHLSEGYNICDNNTMNDILTKVGDKPNTAITLNPIGDNGGLGKSYTLPCNSLAKDAITVAGFNGALAVDQLGNPRVGNADIGAVEYQNPSITSFTTSTVCGTSTATITGVPSTGSINWFATTSSGTVLGSGNTYVTSSLSAPTTFYAEAVDGACVSTPRTAVPVSAVAATSISNQPLASATVCSGNFQTFSVSAAGVGLSYLWSTGETTTGISTSTAGVYFVTVTGFCGAVGSNAAQLTVNNCSILAIPTSSDVTNALFAVYPNPSTGVFEIESASAENYLIINSLGNVVHQGNLTIGKNQIPEIPTKGVYLVRAGNHSRKLVVE